MKVKQRDIILIPFPFSDLTKTKVRPALVISNDSYNQTNLDTVVLAMTSNLSTNLYKIIIDNQDLEMGQLPVKTAIRVDKPFSILQSKIIKTQAKLTIQKFNEVKLIMQQLLA